MDIDESDEVNLKKLERRVRLRRLVAADYPAIRALQQEVFVAMEPWTEKEFLNHIQTFPAGQIGVEVGGKLVATSSSLIVSSARLEQIQSYAELVKDGFAVNHDDDGDYLYGADIAILLDYQGLKLARRLYEARQDLARQRNLKGMIIGGRIPGYYDYADEMSAEAYVDEVVHRKLNDSVLLAQLANGFEIDRVVADYFPEDKESCGYAVLMQWVNPDFVEEKRESAASGIVRLCTVQYQMRYVSKFAEFEKQVEFFVDTASDYRCDFVVFPEILTTQLLPLIKAKGPEEAARKLNRYTGRYLEFFTDLAIRYNVNIIGGSHLVLEDDRVYNVAYLFRRNGTIDKQYKIHITPSEAKWWGVCPGDQVNVFDTDRGKIAILICYDIEFPELARVAVEKGAAIIFVPYNTDMRSAYLRVRLCAHARCIENHCYVVLSGATGNLPAVDNADIHYSQTAILTPSDISFDRDGVAAECTPNVEMVLIHDVNVAELARHKHSGSVRNWLDRRTDIYQVHYEENGKVLKI